MRKLAIGDSVIYVNEFGKPLNALCTQNWGRGEFSIAPDSVYPQDPPSINVVFVTPNEDKTDSCGRQIDRETSVVHRTRQGAHGRYWKFADEA